MKKTQKYYAAAVIAAVWLALALTAWLQPPKKISDTERRELAQFPQLDADRVLDGTFTADFEEYTLDQFPVRDRFRQLKAVLHYHALGQRDNNGIYLSQGYAAKLEYPLNETSVSHALQLFGSIRERYLTDSRIFAAVVPDKNYYLAEALGYPAMDYDRLFQTMQAGMPYADFVDLTESLRLEDYYRTDTHWRQEKLIPAARKLCQAMDVPGPEEGDFSAIAVERPFYGVYYGQAALPMEPDKLYWMESGLLKECKVYNYETGGYGPVYDWTKLEGKDLYEVFLSGPVSLLTVENPNARTDRELIVFRDSFASAMVPLLMQGYRSVTLVDVRYISSAMLSRFLDFHGQDVLFLYSTIVLNNSVTMK